MPELLDGVQALKQARRIPTCPDCLRALGMPKQFFGADGVTRYDVFPPVEAQWPGKALERVAIAHAFDDDKMTRKVVNKVKQRRRARQRGRR